jgi:hypothetical protein
MEFRQEKHPTPIRSTPVSFLDLPRGVRNNIYERLLVLQHPLHIFQEPNSPIESFAPDRPLRWLALLHTNRQVSMESRATLYSMNQFHLEDITPLQTDLLRSFLNCIGPLNAASISHLCINFPVAERAQGQADGIELRTDGLQSVRLCQGQCTNLATLETVVHYKNSGFFREPDDFLREALPLIDVRLRAIRSLRKIIVRFVDFNGIPTAAATDFMQELGWTIVSRNGLQS